VVTNEEISRMLDAKRRGVDVKKEKIESKNYKICPHCKSRNPEKALFCVNCGKKLDQKITVKCPSCGADNAKSAKFCVECGKTLDKKSEISTETSTNEDEKNVSKQLESEDIKTSETESLPVNDDNDGIKKEDLAESEEPKPKTKPLPTIRVPSSVPEHRIINQKDSKKTCSSCQSKNLKNAKFCVVCGEKFTDDIQKDSTEKKNDKTIKDESDLIDNSSDESMEKSENDPIEKIKKAKELLDMGAISEEEFESIKKKYLKQI
jgi:ribosomal protein L40E